MENKIFIIRPYKLGKIWVFDEPTLGLVAEAFVGGATQAIDRMLKLKGKITMKKGFNLIFSDEFFPNYTAKATKCPKEVQPESGTLYEWETEGMIFWLCNALTLFFKVPPDVLYAKIELDF